MQFTGRYMAVIDAGEAEFSHHSAEVLHIGSKTFRRNSRVFDDADRLSIAVGAGKDA